MTAVEVIETVPSFIAVALGLLGLAQLVLFAWLVYRLALVRAQKEAMDVRSVVIEGYKDRIEQLEEKVCGLEQQMVSKEEEIAELKRTIRSLIDTVADTDRCLIAKTCKDRVIPTD